MMKQQWSAMLLLEGCSAFVVYIFEQRLADASEFWAF
jgi:hypothetical protein